MYQQIKTNTMTTLEIKTNGRILKATINILSACVIISTDFDGFKRTASYSSIEEAINNTTIVPVKEYLKSL